MTRFTISRHTGSQEGDHFDLMLESGEALKTWRVQHLNFENPQSATRIKDHRKKYLDFEGAVSGAKGRVHIHDTGTYTVDLWSDKLIQVSLSGASVRARLRLEQKKEDEWTVVDAAAGLRRLVSSHLRNVELDSAPTPELESLREDLAKEERKLLAFVARYSKGEIVDWAQADLDNGIRERLKGEWVRWRHPWLDQAKAFAERVAGLAVALRDAKTAVTTKS